MLDHSLCQLVIASQYSDHLHHQLTSKENKKKATSTYQVLMDGLPHILTDPDFCDAIFKAEAHQKAVELEKKQHVQACCVATAHKQEMEKWKEDLVKLRAAKVPKVEW